MNLLQETLQLALQTCCCAVLRRGPPFRLARSSHFRQLIVTILKFSVTGFSVLSQFLQDTTKRNENSIIRLSLKNSSNSSSNSSNWLAVLSARRAPRTGRQRRCKTQTPKVAGLNHHLLHDDILRLIGEHICMPRRHDF